MQQRCQTPRVITHRSAESQRLQGARQEEGGSVPPLPCSHLGWHWALHSPTLCCCGLAIPLPQDWGSALTPATSSSSALAPFHRLNTSHPISPAKFFLSLLHILVLTKSKGNETNSSKLKADSRDVCKKPITFLPHFHFPHPSQYSTIPLSQPTCSRPHHTKHRARQSCRPHTESRHW